MDGQLRPPPSSPSSVSDDDDSSTTTAAAPLWKLSELLSYGMLRGLVAPFRMIACQTVWQTALVGETVVSLGCKRSGWEHHVAKADEPDVSWHGALCLLLCGAVAVLISQPHSTHWRSHLSARLVWRF